MKVIVLLVFVVAVVFLFLRLSGSEQRAPDAAGEPATEADLEAFIAPLQVRLAKRGQVHFSSLSEPDPVFGDPVFGGGRVVARASMLSSSGGASRSPSVR